MIVRKIIFYSSLMSSLLACDGTSFSGDGNSARPSPSAEGDQAGVGQDTTNPDGSGDTAGVNPEEAKQRLEVLEDQLRRQQAERERLGHSDDVDNAFGGACPIFSRDTQASRTSIALRDGSRTPEVPGGINIADLARSCTPAGNDCNFRFLIYRSLNKTNGNYTYYATLPPGEVTTGYVGMVYDGSITNYRLASCDVLALTTPSEVPRTRDGCFAPETKIMTSIGAKPIRDIQAGDLIYSPISKNFSPVVQKTVGPEAKALIEVGYQGKTVRVTTEHPFITVAGLKQAQELTKADRLLTEKKGEYAPIEVLRQLPVQKDQMVYNIHVFGESFANRVIVADGIVTGDLRMQQDLANERRSQPSFHQPLVMSLAY